MNVLIIQNVMKQYRAPLYPKLFEALSREGICLKVAYSLPGKQDQKKKDNVQLPDEYGVIVPNKLLFGERAVWTSCWGLVKQADLVIVEQANRNLINYILILRSWLKLTKLALWGHGRNMQGRAASLRERFKGSLLNAPDYWFAYTQSTRDYIYSKGFPGDKITVLNNSIDTTGFRQALAAVTEKQIGQFCETHSIDVTAPIALSCSSLYKEKKVEFLIDAAMIVRERLPGFQLLVVGAGPDSALLECAATKNPWIKVLGPLYSAEKAIAFRLCKMVVNPGLVGLGVLDCFVAGKPMMTTKVPFHSPEFSYLEHGVNGFVTECDAEIYGAEVVELFLDEPRLAQVSEAALKSSDKYSIESMAMNFYSGIVKCLTDR